MDIPPAVEDVLLSVLTHALTVALGEGLRRSLRDIIPHRHHFLALEVIFTFQLCFLLHDLWLLVEVGKVSPAVALPLLYGTIAVHCWTSTCALCNPSTALQHLMTGHSTFAKTTEKIFCQMAGAALAWLAASQLHRLDLTRLHCAAGPECSSHLHTSIEQGAAVELGLAFLFHSMLRLLHHSEEKYRVHIIGLTYAALVGAGGHLTGAMFNPALALSLNFFCKGNTIPENMFVYWLGPVAGMILSVALFEHVIPIATRSYNRIMGREAEATGDKID